MLPNDLDRLTLANDSSSSRLTFWPRSWSHGRFSSRRTGDRQLRVVLTVQWPRLFAESIGVHPPIPGREPRKKGDTTDCARVEHGASQRKRVQDGDDRAGDDRSCTAYFTCKACSLGGYMADRILGLEGFLTRQATRLICLLGGQKSFAATERLLNECCGWTVSDERIRQACQAESTRIVDFRANVPAVAEAFASAAGDIEFQTDAAKVNTTGGWRGHENRHLCQA